MFSGCLPEQALPEIQDTDNQSTSLFLSETRTVNGLELEEITYQTTSPKINRNKSYIFSIENFDALLKGKPSYENSFERGRCIPVDYDRFTYHGCCCIDFIGYGPSPFPAFPASLSFSRKKYEPLDPNANTRFYLKVLINGIVMHEHYWGDNTGYCGNYGQGFVLDLGDCSGNGTVIYGLGVLSNGVFDACVMKTGSFYYPGVPDACDDANNGVEIN